MIVGHIEQTGSERGYAPVLREAIGVLRSADWSAKPPGTYEIDGDRMYVMVQEMTTEPRDRRRPESHRKYIDIQYLLDGAERIGVTRRRGAEPIAEDMLEGKDVVYYEDVAHDAELDLTPGMYAVFFPDDIHRPCCNVNGETRIKKAVLKLKVSALSILEE